MNEELKPCPFCGGEGVVVHEVFYTVNCKQCGAGVRTARNQDYKAIKLWNTRTPSPREQKLVEALRQHHKWQEKIGQVAFEATAENGLNEMVVLNLSAECAESSMCEKTIEALSAYDAPGSQGCEKAPISEKEAVEIMLACTQDHVARGGKAGKACMQLIYRALAKRLWWM